MAYEQEDQNQPALPGMEPAQPPALDPNAPIQLKPGEGQDQDLAEKALVDELIGQFGRWSDWRRPLEAIWQTIYRLYMGRPDRTKIATRAKVVIPKVFQIVETGVAKLMSITLAGCPSAAARLIKRPSPSTITLLPLDLTLYSSTNGRTVVGSLAISRNATRLSSRSKCPLLQTIAPSFIFEKCSPSIT